MCMGADSSKSDGKMSEAHDAMMKTTSSGSTANSNSRRANTSNKTSFFSGNRNMISPVAASGKTDMTTITRASGSIGSSIATSLVPIKRPKMLKVSNTISSLLSYSPTVKMFRGFKSRNDGI